MTKYVEAPKRYYNPYQPSIFLAGGITNCRDWQTEAYGYLSGYDITVYNPRRESFDVTDPSATDVQIEWEFEFLNKVDVVLFWFAEGDSVQPITLYELGRHAAQDKDIVVGRSLDYLRKADVDKQMELARPDLLVLESLADTVQYARMLAELSFFRSERRDG